MVRGAGGSVTFSEQDMELRDDKELIFEMSEWGARTIRIRRKKDDGSKG